jgi:hypothetical protein
MLRRHERSPNDGVTMPESRRSKRFHPNTITEKIVPVLLVILLLVLLAVLIITGLSLVR